MFTIQTGQGRGKFATVESLSCEPVARMAFASLPMQAGEKKRLVGPDGKVICRKAN